MKKNMLFLITLILSLVLIMGCNGNKKEPVTFTQDESVELLTIDQKISTSEVIIVGTAKSLLPSKWLVSNGASEKNPSPEEVFRTGGLFTDALFSVEQVLKGEYNEPIIRVRSFIGETEQVRWVNLGQPIFREKQSFLMFLIKDTGPTSIIDSGDYISVNSKYAIYEIIDGKAISSEDEWILAELIEYIQNSLSNP